MSACSVYMMAWGSVPAFTAFKSTFQSVGHLVTDYIKTYIKWELTFFLAHAYKNIVDLSKLIIFHKEALCYSIVQIIFFLNQTIIIICFITLVLFTCFEDLISLSFLISYALKNLFFSKNLQITYMQKNVLCLQLWSLYPGRQPRQ